jgi:hypothetical protein
MNFDEAGIWARTEISLYLMDGANKRLHDAAESGDAKKLQVSVAPPCSIRALAVKWPSLASRSRYG